MNHPTRFQIQLRHVAIAEKCLQLTGIASCDNTLVELGNELLSRVPLAITAASTHDTQTMPDLIEKADLAVHADSAYTGETIAMDLLEKGV